MTVKHQYSVAVELVIIDTKHSKHINQFLRINVY